MIRLSAPSLLLLYSVTEPRLPVVQFCRQRYYLSAVARLIIQHPLTFYSSTIHNVQPGVPVENLLALYAAINEFRAYSVS